MKLYEEFLEYETLWENIELKEAAASKQQSNNKNNSLGRKESGVGLKPYSKQKLICSTASKLLIALLLPLAGVSPIVAAGVALTAPVLIAELLEAANYHRMTKDFPGIKQLATKNSDLKQEICRLVNEVGVENAAKALESLEAYITTHPEVFDEEVIDAVLEITYDPVEQKKVVGIALATNPPVNTTTAESFNPAVDSEMETFVADLVTQFSEN